MSNSLIDNSIKAGTLDLLLNKTTIHENDSSTLDWIPFNYNHWDFADIDKRKANMIRQLQGNHIIQPTCYHRSGTSFIRVRIYVILVSTEFIQQDFYGLNYRGSTFLELMLLLDRRSHFFSSNPITTIIKKPVLSPFNQEKHQSLLNMFIHMPSPKRFELPDDVEPAIQQFLNKIDDMACPSGMKTNLYHYQKASLWKILQRELAPLQVPRPDVVELISVDGIKYYYHQLGGVATLTQGLQKDVPGGIICEDMGTGKTCICLAAIMATKQVLPSLQDVIIKTDFLEFYNNPQDNYGFKSLRTLAGIQTMLHSADWRSYRSQLPFEIASAFENSAPYYEWTPIQHHALIDRPHRRHVEVPVLKVYLSAATLVVVPDNLVAQWTGEIYKHIHDGQLDFLVLDNKKHPIPEPLRLVQLDMVLISQSRFSHENSTGGFDFQGIPRECNCPYIGSTRTRNCTCPVIIDKPTYTSPLLQIHWKRVIVDEGHSLSARNSRQSNLSAKLFACWNWICTGTPTQNLTEVAILRTRQEGIADDLARLGILLGDILKLKPYASSKKLWPQFVVKPFILGKPWATNNVNNIMCRTMIRNQRSTIEHEVILPPLHCKTVELEFDYYQWLAHNCQISMINLNAILSKREGPDYLFSKNNQKALRETVSNLRQSCTWHSIDIQSLRSSYANCMEKLKQVDEGTEHYGADEPGLRQLKQLFELALGDPVFMDMMTKHEISFVVQGLPNLMKETWGWHKGARGAYMPVSANIWDDHCIVSGDIIVDLMHDVTNLKNANKNIYVYNSNTKILESTEVYERRKKMQQKMATMNDQRKTKRKKNNQQTIAIKPKNNNGNRQTYQQDKSNGKQLSSNASSIIGITNDYHQLDTSDTSGLSPKTMELNNDSNIEQDDSTALTFYTRSVFTDVRVLCSTSSKINYLVDQILSHHTKEKCLIFSQYYNEMQEIYLALQLVKVRVLMYLDTSMSSVKRSQTIMTFNTSDNANVMIMAVQKAAYGIDLSSASRVYFVSPVWQAAMEQQAIKRAHRIGQTKPVYVETLVIRNSIEDALLKRRNVIAAAHQDQSKTDFYSDKRLQNILNHANIVPRPDHIQLSSDGISFHQPMSFLNKPIWLTPPVPTPPSSPISTTKTKSSPNLYAVSKLKEEMDLDVTSGTDSPRKRQKVVSFTLS